MSGVNAAVAYTITGADTEEVRSGYLSEGAAVLEQELYKGNYTVSLTLPDGVLLTSVNGYPNLQKKTVEWIVTVVPMQTHRYEVELTSSGGITGSMDEMSAPAEVTISGQRMSETLSVSGAFVLTELYPDTYQITAKLPRGLYDAPDWLLQDAADGVTASLTVTVNPGETVVLPILCNRATGEASGTVLDVQGTAIAGALVQLTKPDGTLAAEAITDENGAWQLDLLEYGTYLITYDTMNETAIASGTLTISEEPVVLTAQATHLAALNVHVFRDNNNNGSRSQYEEGVAGAKLSLISVVGGMEVVEAEGESNSQGEATLMVPAGDYILRAELPAGFGFGIRSSKNLGEKLSVMEESNDRVQNSTTLTLSAGSVTDVGVGVMTMAALKGMIWLDENDDGIYQDGEPGQAGIKITATGVKNGLVYETESAEDGTFYIGQIRYGTYNVEYTLPDGLVFARYSNTGGSRRSIITSEFKRSEKDQMIFERGDLLETLVGVMKGSNINGICFQDENGNGVWDEGEATLEGVKVVLYRQSINKELLNTVSDADGRFSFTNIRGSTFRVKATIPQGYVYTVAGEGEYANQFVSGTERREYTLSDVVLENDSEMTLAIGAVTYGTISGTVYRDEDFSGSFESGENLVNGMKITLTDAQGESRTVKTNKNGVYTFDKVLPGEYILSATADSGLAFTIMGSGSVLKNLSDGMGESEPFTLSMGENLVGMDMGLVVPGKVSGTVFADRNDNGLMDEDEKGLSGAKVTLKDENGEVFSATISTSGEFTFDAVLPGSYYLTYELPDGSVFAPVVEGGNQITEEGVSEWFSLSVGGTVNAPLCGGLALGEMNAIFFADHNGNGEMDEGEEPLANVSIVLTPSRDDLDEYSACTDEDGTFHFSGLRPDTYTMTIIFPEGMVLSAMNSSVTLPLTQGLNEQKIDLEVTHGSQWPDQQLGGVIPAQLTGRVWMDENNDGQMDEGEYTPENETLELLDANGVLVANLTTDGEGCFAIDGLAPGVYSLVYPMAEGVLAPQAGQSTFTEQDSRMVMENIIVAEAETIDTPMLGLRKETTIGGLVWLDNGGDIELVSGATVALLDAEGGELESLVTGEDGLYAFTGLMPGDYLLSVQLPADHVVVEAADERLSSGELISVMTQCGTQQGQSDPITLRMGQDLLTQNIGSVKSGTLGDFCWLDLNGNGLQDSGELGLAYMTVELWRNGQKVASTTTDEYGFYRFEKLYPGVYTLKVDYPAQVKPTQQRTDFPSVASVMGEADESIPVQVQSAAETLTADLGFVLVEDGVYPASYGVGAQQDWTQAK